MASMVVWVARAHSAPKSPSVVLVVILVIGVALAPMTIAVPEDGVVSTPEDAKTEKIRVTINPGQLYESIRAGNAFSLPTGANESMQFQSAVRQGDGGEILQRNEQGRLVHLGHHDSNVWSTTSTRDNSRALILSLASSLRATIWTEGRIVNIEPTSPPSWMTTTTTSYALYDDVYQEPVPGTPSHFEPLTQEHQDTASRDPAPSSGTDDPITIPTAIPGSGEDSGGQRETMTAYADDEYYWQYGLGWADQVDYIIAKANVYFEDIDLYHDVETYIQDDPGTGDDSPWSEGWNWIKNQPWHGNLNKAYFSYADYDGCKIGQAFEPGTVAMWQHKPDACHAGIIPDTDFERAYITAHELGHNSDGGHADAWSAWSGADHQHRSIMHESAWYHYHECWSQGNLDRMTEEEGTAIAGEHCS